MKQLTNLMDATMEPKQQTASNKPGLYFQYRSDIRKFSILETGWCHRQLAYYFSLLCFLLTLVTLLQTLYIVSVTLMFQSQSSLQQSRLTELTYRLDSVQQAYQLLFTKYPALHLYCPVTNTTSKERKCEPCPEGWLFVGERCYLFSKDRADWISSQYHCMTLGGTLVLIRTQEEQVFLWNQAQSLSQGDSYWLGLRSSVYDGTWQWTDSTPVDRSPQFWYHIPDEERNKEMCGRLSPGDSHSYQMSWYTSSCGNHLKSICQRTQGTLQ